MTSPARRAATLALVLAAGLMCQGCLGLAAAGAIGAGAAVVGGTVKVAGAVGSAIVPGESKKQRAKRLEREERQREKEAREARRRT